MNAHQAACPGSILIAFADRSCPAGQTGATVDEVAIAAFFKFRNSVAAAEKLSLIAVPSAEQRIFGGVAELKFIGPYKGARIHAAVGADGEFADAGTAKWSLGPFVLRLVK